MSALLDRSNVDMYLGEILLTAVLEACTRLGEFSRLEGVLASYVRCSMTLKVRTYGSLIKACGAWKQCSSMFMPPTN